MSELTLVLDRKSLVVTMDAGVIRVDQPGCQPEKIPLNMVRQVIVNGSPVVSCDVWRALAEQNVPAVLFPARGKGEPAYMGAGLSATVVNRMAQYQASRNQELSLAVSRRLVEGKLQGQVSVLQQFDSEHLTGTYQEGIEAICRGLDSASDTAELMGFEGAAAAAYFKAIGRILPEEWKFTGRNRRPPRDPVNSLMSLSYVIACGEIRRELQSRGLDPCLGFFHRIQSGRESLVLDILEPTRPEIDRFVLHLLDYHLNPSDFRTSRRDGCRLTKKGRRMFYEAWAAWLEREEDDFRNLRQMTVDVIRQVLDLFAPEQDDDDPASERQAGMPSTGG